MNYCETCHILCEEAPCPQCGSRYVRQPREKDYIFLTEMQFLEAELLEGALKEEGIPVVTDESVVGAWLCKTVDSLGSRHRIFVPWGNLARVEQIMTDMFSEEIRFEDFKWEETEP